MKVFRWGVSAIAAVLLAGGSSFAGNTDELSAMKATMENMKQEMEAMRATISAEREAMRANAGGAPEALKSANGKATIKIGGDVKIRYNYGWQSYYSNTTANAGNNHNQRRTRSGWDMNKAALKFKITFTPDTKAYVCLRADNGSAGVGGLLDEAWYEWSNIGGTGFALKVGLQTIEYGLFNGDNDPWGRVMILDSFCEDQAISSIGGIRPQSAAGRGTFSHEQDITSIGVQAAYKWDQFKVVAGVCADEDYIERDMGVTASGDNRNNGVINHYFTFYYDPCWLEGLHLQAGYHGKVDDGQGNSTITFNPDSYYGTARGGYYGGANYNANFDAGAVYVADCWAVYAEVGASANPNFLKGAFQIASSFGADYSITEKLAIGGTFDMMYTTADSFAAGDVTGVNANGFNEWNLRAGLGAKYKFGNGIYVQAQYSHWWTKAFGLGDDRCKDLDLITFQTGFKF